MQYRGPRRPGPRRRPQNRARPADASANGAAAHPAWYVNLLANSNATVEVGPEKLTVRARTAKGKERDKLAKLVEYLEPQQKLTSRQIPVVALEPVKSRKT